MKLVHKLTLGFLVVALLSSTTGFFAINHSKNVLKKTFIENTKSLAIEVLVGIEKEIKSKIEVFQVYSHDLLLQDSVLKANRDFEKLDDVQSYINKRNKEWTAVSENEVTPFMQGVINNRLSNELRARTDYFKEHYPYSVFEEVSITNKYGANIAQTGKTTDYRQDDEDWWQGAKEEVIYIKNVEYDEGTDAYSIGIGLRIDDKNGKFIGVMKVVLNIEDIINLIKKIELSGIHKNHRTMKFSIATKEGKLIYSTKKGFKFLDDVSFLLPEQPLSTEAGYNIFKNKNGRNSDIFSSHAHLGRHKNFKNLDWILIVEQEAKELFAPVTNLRNRILTILIIVTIISIILGFFASTYFTQKFKKLRDAAVEIGQGNLDTRIDVRTTDEIGQLASAFQKMTEDLKMSTVARDKLVNEIAERKRAEETIQLQLKRFNVLRFIDMTITASLDLQVTLDILIILITTQLGIDAVAVLLLNKETEMLEYVASKGFRTGALKYTKLKLGDSNAGRAAMQQQIVTIPDLKQDPDGFLRSKVFANEDFITYFAVPLIAKGQVKGVLEFFHRTTLKEEQDWMEFIENVADQAAIAIDNATLFNELQLSNIELTRAYDSTIEGWSRAMDLRDKETEGHTQRVTDMTIFIARYLGVKDEELLHMKRGALLHDMGKMGIPDSILLKPGSLTEEEWKIMKLHPVYAYDMLYPIDYLRPALDIPYCHHEKWDGTGYPRGLRGDEIPLAARIFAVVDVYDALISDRPYRPAWPKEKVIKHISSSAGTHFDPFVTELFLRIAIKLKEPLVKV